MDGKVSLPSPRWLRWLQLGVGVYALVGGVTSFLGWGLDIRRLTDWDNTGISILPNAAICAAFSGLSLLMLAFHRRRVALVCGALVAIIGIATALEWVTGTHLGISIFLLFDRGWGNVGAAYPGRIGPPATISWALIGTALVLAAVPASAVFGRIISVLGLLTLTIGLISTIGHLYSASILYALPRVSVIAFQTATFVVASAVGLITCAPDRQPMRSLLAQDGAGLLARRMLPILILLPILLGFMRVRAVHVGLFDSAFGTTLAVIIEIILLCGLLFSVIRLIKRYERAQRASAERTDAILGSITDAFLSMDKDWCLTFVNEEMVQRMGKPRAQILGKALWELFSDTADDETRTKLRRAMTAREPTVYEVFYPPWQKWFHDSVYPTADGGLAIYSRDITERKRSEQKRAELAAIVESSDDAIVSRDVNGIITSWNRGAEKLYGYTAPEAIGKPVTILMTPERADEDPANLARILGGETVQPYETVRRRKDGTLVEVSLTVSPIISETGAVVGASKIARDISDRKRQQREVARISERLQLVTDAAPALISYVDSNGRYRFVNKGYQEWFGHRREDIVGREMSDVVGEAAFARLKPHVDAALRGQREAFEAEIPYKDGGTRFIHAEYVPDARPDGVVMGFYVMVTDITENKRAELALRAAKESVEAANMAKDNFLATLSHELRTPLTPVMATLGAWGTMASFPDSLREDLAMVRRNLDLEARLIDDLLDLTRIVKGKMEINLEVLDLNKLIESVVGMYRSEIRAKKLDISLCLDATKCHIRGDPGRLQQVFWNLLKNAVKFTPEGGRIEVTTRNEGHGHLQITITDTGVGMPVEFLARLFTPFAQGHVDSVRRYGGLGLGLAITKKLLEAHGGTIEAKSDGIGHGSTFIITLACVEPTSKIPPTDTASSRERLTEPEKRIRVLLVEDHDDTARVMERLLQINGHDVRRARSVAEAIEALRESDCDVLLSDIGLPDGTGIDLITHVRAQYGPSIPAVAMTGYGMEEDVARCIDAGFGHHLTKPVNFARLEETIQRACATNIGNDGIG